MHILKIIHGYPSHYNAGSEVYSQSICNELSKTHRVSIFTREENPFESDFTLRVETETPSRNKYLVNMPRGKDGYRHPELDEAFSNLLDQLKPDVAHIGHLNHLSTGIVDVLKEKSIPIVFTLHDFWLMCPRGQFLQRNFGDGELYELCHYQENKTCASKCYKSLHAESSQSNSPDQIYWESWVGRRMNETRRVTEMVNILIAPSQYLRSRFIHEFGIQEDKIIYLDYGFPLEYLSPVKHKDGGEFTFGYIGTHIPAKGIQHLLLALSKLNGKAILRIWGRHRGQETEGLKTLAKNLRIEDRIEWMGEYVNQNIAQAVFSHCDVIVVPSIWAENSPLVIHEAQACAVPVITADFGGMSEYVHHRVNGLLFEHRNSESLANQMQWAMENVNEMREFGKRGYLNSPDGKIQDISAHCRNLDHIYQQVINANGK